MQALGAVILVVLALAAVQTFRLSQSQTMAESLQRKYAQQEAERANARATAEAEARDEEQRRRAEI